MVPQPALTSDPRFQLGLALYRRGEFFVCHEVLEELWQQRTGRDRFFVQSLIHLAVAFHHWNSANRTGALLQLEKSARKLAGYLPAFAGIDSMRLYRDLERAIAALRDGGPLHPIDIY